MCQSVLRGILFLLAILHGIFAIPVGSPHEVESTTESAPAPLNDTTLAKFGNTTIIFGHQHVLFSAPTRQPQPRVRVGVNQVAPSSVQLPSRQSKVDTVDVDVDHQDQGEGPRRIDYTASEEEELFNFSNEVEEDEAKRQELCPGKGRGRQQVLYDPLAGKCGKVGTPAHCGTNMVFRYDPFVDNSTVYGYCECDYAQRTPLVYHPETKNCYFIYQKAYCESKEWLVFNSQGEPSCEKRTCPKSSSRRSKLLTELVEVPLNGTGPCVPLGQPSKHCPDPEETVYFARDELVPRCGIERRAPAPRIISPIRQTRCRPGSYVNIVGRCQPAWEW